MRRAVILAVALAAIIVAATAPAMAAAWAPTGIAEDLGYSRKFPRPRFLSVNVTEVGDSYVAVESDALSGKLVALGTWLYVHGAEAGRARWAEIKDRVSTGPAVAAVVEVERGDKRVLVLAGLRQGEIGEGLLIVRPWLLRRCAERLLSTRHYLGIYANVTVSTSHYMLVETRAGAALAILQPGSKWYVAGRGEATWSEVAGEFRKGDLIRIFCHNVLILSDEFAEHMGFKALIWGYSGAIINLTTGTTVCKFVEKTAGA